MSVPVGEILLLAEKVAALCSKKLKTKKISEIFAKAPGMADAYLSGCAKLQTAADAGEGLGPLSADEVKAIAMGDDITEKGVKKLKRLLSKAA